TVAGAARAPRPRERDPREDRRGRVELPGREAEERAVLGEHRRAAIAVRDHDGESPPARPWQVDHLPRAEGGHRVAHRGHALALPSPTGLGSGPPGPAPQTPSTPP